MTKKEIKIKQREDEQGGVSASLGKQPLRSLKNRLADKNGLHHVLRFKTGISVQHSDFFGFSTV